MGQSDRFDVVVVGARASGPQAVVALAAAIERRAGVTQATFQLGLSQGGATIHHGVPKSEAITLARTLQELGAVVDVRASRSDDSAPILLEPDAEATAVPPAPPPFVSEVVEDDDSDLLSLHALDAEPARPVRRSPTGEVDHSRPQGQPARLEPERPFGAERKPRRASQPGPSTVPRAGDSQRVATMQDSQRIPVATDSQRVPRAGDSQRVPTPARGVATPRRAEPARPAPASPRPAEARAVVPNPKPFAPPQRPSDPPPQRPSAAPRRNTTEVASPDEGGPLDPGAEAISQAALGAAPPPARFAPPSPGGRLELDLAAVGLASAPAGSSALTRGRGGSEQSGTRGLAEQSGARGLAEQSGARRPAELAGSGGFPSPMDSTSVRTAPPSGSGAFERGLTLDGRPPPTGEPAGMLASDRVTSGILGAALAAMIGLAIAYGWVRRDALAIAERLEGELRDSIADPIGVDDGRARAPATIADELAEAMDEQRTRYLQVWALVTVPLGLVLGLLKRGSASA